MGIKYEAYSPYSATKVQQKMHIRKELRENLFSSELLFPAIKHLWTIDIILVGIVER